jgi:D-lactate dehydrogenase (quinone)
VVEIGRSASSGWLASEGGTFIMPHAEYPTSFIAALKGIVGTAHVLTAPRATEPYRTSLRSGGGKALAVVRPGSLVELWRVLQACVTANKVVIAQAANTGLTGGSTPAGDDYDREVVIINTLRMSRLLVIEDGHQVICFPGTTLHQLEQALKPYDREPHSVIGSSCVGASVIGGICNNSGGALVRRGPAYTQMALFARVDKEGCLHLVNHLGVELSRDDEQMLDQLERGNFGVTDIDHHPIRFASDHDYARRVREIDSDSPARFNADPERLFEASGSAGKVIVFAVRLDTFPRDLKTRVFYIGTQDPAELAALRRHILLRFETLPVAAEYLHRDAFDIAAVYGKDTFLMVRLLGTNWLPSLFKLKRSFDYLVSRLGLSSLGASDQWFQRLSYLFPNHLPAMMNAYRDRFEHHLMLKMSGGGIEEAAKYLKSIFPSASGDYFECAPEEGVKAFLHRYVAAGAAMRYRALHGREVEDILALDVALKRNDARWFETLPKDVLSQVRLALYYGHFLCHVFHQDYIVRKGGNVAALKDRLLRLLDERGAEYPAEHNVGHLYRAKPALTYFYRGLDPCNQFNPGLGQTSKFAHWK